MDIKLSTSVIVYHEVVCGRTGWASNPTQALFISRAEWATDTRSSTALDVKAKVRFTHLRAKAATARRWEQEAASYSGLSEEATKVAL